MKVQHRLNEVGLLGERGRGRPVKVGHDASQRIDVDARLVDNDDVVVDLGSGFGPFKVALQVLEEGLGGVGVDVASGRRGVE